MLLNLLKNSEFRDVLKLCSPALFKVVPPKALALQVKELADRPKVALNEVAFPAVPELEVVPRPKGGPLLPSKPEHRAWTGAAILRLYFAQIYTDAPTWLDLRPDAFRVEHTTLEWSPARLAIVWQEDFLLHLRALYQGFYQGDDAGFRAALKDLRLLSVETLFRQHFGDGDQTEVVFSTRHFMKTFTEIFEASARSKISLHRNFVALGFYLASLYQSLEGLGGPFDVRAAFFASGGETFAR